MRGRILDALLDRMKKDDRIFFLTADMGINLVEKIQSAFPSRYLNVGIAEQNLIGVSAGLCNTGYRPFVYTISQFLIHRCYEQIRNDIGLHCYPITLLGTSTGFDNAPLGPTHHIVDDWGVLRNIPGIDIYCPSSVKYADTLMDKILAKERPAYIRIPKGAFEQPDSDQDFVYLEGKKEGILLISYGFPVQNCLKVQAQNENVSLLVCNRLRPLDAGIMKEVLKSHSRAMIIEDHFPDSGLYGLLCQFCMEHEIPCKLESIAPDQYSLHVGSSPAYYASRYGYDVESLNALILKKHGQVQ